MMPTMDMMNHCAPMVSPVTMAAIIQVESGGNPFTIGVNGLSSNRPHSRSFEQAVYWANYYIHLGYSVDLGLMQVNSRNLTGLGYNVKEILDPCINLQAGSRILSRGYAGASKQLGPGQNALKAALSAYNTGNYERGFHNGYVAKYYSHRVQVVVSSHLSKRLLAATVINHPLIPLKKADNPYLADTTVYKRIEPITETSQATASKKDTL